MARYDLQGSLDLLVLKTLSQRGELHGYGIVLHIQHASDALLRVEEGSLYPALKRLELKGWISAKWETSERNRRARVYKLTPAGRKQLRQEHSKWAEFVAAVSHVMEAAS